VLQGRAAPDDKGPWAVCVHVRVCVYMCEALPAELMVGADWLRLMAGGTCLAGLGHAGCWWCLKV